MEELIGLLNEIKPGHNYREEKGLIENGVLHSLDILELVSGISEMFDIEISPSYIVPENFDSAQSIWRLIEKVKEEG